MIELNIDGLPGPSHHYAGLAHGNIASETNAGGVSNPRGALLQGIEKMRLMLSLGIPQAVLPPHPRPVLRFLHDNGVTGTEQEMVLQAPDALLSTAYSSSAMWSANAATVLPSIDSKSGLLTVIPANLSTNAHRALEAPVTAKNLKTILPFAQHLPVLKMSDEGAANHMRLSGGSNVLHIFVCGMDGKKYTARQSKASCEAHAELLKVPSVILNQTPEAIDAGVFHNDVIATSHGAYLFYHEDAYEEMPELPAWVVARKITRAELSLAEAVSTYLFNSQMVTASDGSLHWIAPLECAENSNAKKLLESFPVSKIHYVDLKQSMRNGGGPACLRLRVQLQKDELAKVKLVTNETLSGLEEFAKKHYRDRLELSDLRDKDFMQECMEVCEKIKTWI